MVVIRVTESNESLIGTLALISSSLPAASSQQTRSPRKAPGTGAKPSENPPREGKRTPSRVPVSWRTSTQTKDLTSAATSTPAPRTSCKDLTSKEEKPTSATRPSHTQAAGTRQSAIPRWAPASSKKGTKLSDSRTPAQRKTKIPKSSTKKTASEKTEVDTMKAVGSPPKIDVVTTELDTALMTDSMTPPGKTDCVNAPLVTDLMTFPSCGTDIANTELETSPVLAMDTPVATRFSFESPGNSATSGTDSLVEFQRLEAEITAEDGNQLRPGSQQEFQQRDQEMNAEDVNQLRLGSEQVVGALKSSIEIAPQCHQFAIDQQAAEQHCELRYVATQQLGHVGGLHDITESSWESESPQLQATRISVPRVSEVEVIRQIPITSDEQWMYLPGADNGEHVDRLDRMATTMESADIPTHQEIHLTQSDWTSAEPSIYDCNRSSSSSDVSHGQIRLPLDSPSGSSPSQYGSPLSESELWRKIDDATVTLPVGAERPDVSSVEMPPVRGLTIDEDVDFYDAYRGPSPTDMGSQQEEIDFDNQWTRSEEQRLDHCSPATSPLASRMGLDLTQPRCAETEPLDYVDKSCPPAISPLASRTGLDLTLLSGAETEPLDYVDKSEKHMEVTRESFVAHQQSLTNPDSLTSAIVGTISPDDFFGDGSLGRPMTSTGAFGSFEDDSLGRPMTSTGAFGSFEDDSQGRPMTPTESFGSMSFGDNGLGRRMTPTESFGAIVEPAPEASARDVSRLELKAQDEELARLDRQAGMEPSDFADEMGVGLTQAPMHHLTPAVHVASSPSTDDHRKPSLARSISRLSCSSFESIMSEESGRSASRLEMKAQDEGAGRNRQDDTQNLRKRTGSTRGIRRQYSRLPLTTATDCAAESFESFQECQDHITAARTDATMNAVLDAHNLEWVPTPNGLVTMPKGCLETEERLRQTRQHFINPVPKPQTAGVSFTSVDSWFGSKMNNKRGKGSRVKAPRTTRTLGLTWEEIRGPDGKCVGWKQPTTFACRVPQHRDYLNDLDSNLTSRCFADKLPAPREYNDTPFADLSREVLRTMASNLLVSQLRLCPGAAILRMPPTPSFKEIRKPWMNTLKEIVSKHMNSSEKPVARLILNAYRHQDHDGNSDHEEFRGFLVLLTVLDRLVMRPDIFEHVTAAVFRANELNLLKGSSNITMMITVHDPCRATLSNCVFAPPDEKDAYLQGVLESDPEIINYYMAPSLDRVLTANEHRALVTLMAYTSAFSKAAPEIAVLNGLEAWADVIKNFSTNRLAAVGRNTSEPGIPFLDMGFRGPLAASLEHLQDGLAFSVMAMTKNVKNPGRLIENTLCALPMMDHIIHYLQMVGVFDNRHSSSLRRPLVDLVDSVDVIATKSHNMLCGLKSRPWMTKEDVAYTLTSLDCICQGLHHNLVQKHSELTSKFRSVSKQRVNHKQQEKLVRLQAQLEALAISETRLVEIHNHLSALRDIKGVQEYLRMFGTSVHNTDLRYMTAPSQCQTLQDQYMDRMESRMTVSAHPAAAPGRGRLSVRYAARDDPRVGQARNAGRTAVGTSVLTLRV